MCCSSYSVVRVMLNFEIERGWVRVGGYYEKDEDEEVCGVVFGVIVVVDIYGIVCFRVDFLLLVVGGGCVGVVEFWCFMIDGLLLLDL